MVLADSPLLYRPKVAIGSRHGVESSNRFGTFACLGAVVEDKRMEAWDRTEGGGGGKKEGEKGTA
jgi:hypothetical protein